MSAARRTVVALLPGPAGDGSWVDAAQAALDQLGPDVEVTVQRGVPQRLPHADVLLCHGIQYAPLVQSQGQGRVVVLSDHPADPTGLEHVTIIDWSWHEAARLAGRVAAAVAGAEPVGLIAGPPVRTQALVAGAFTRGVLSTGHAAPIVEHLPSFSDVGGGEESAARLVGELGCRIVLTTADAAGDAGAAIARAHGAATIGFLHGHPDDLAHIRSDVTGVLAGALRAALEAGASGGIVRAGLASGHLTLELREDAPEAARAALLP